MNKRLTILFLLAFCAKLLLAQYNTSVLEHHTDIKIENNKLVKELSILIQINDKESSWISDVMIPHNANEKLKIIDAVITDLNGNIIRELKKKEITTRSDISRGSFYEDSYMTEFKLKWEEYPFRIRYKYRIIKNKFLYVSKWTPLLYPYVPVEKASLNIQLPHNYKVNIEYSDGFIFEADTINNKTVFNWKAENVWEVGRQTYSPPPAELLPKVTVVPIEFNYGKKGSFESWRSYGQWHYSLNKNLDRLPESEIYIIDSLLGNVKEDREKINILYRYLQNNTRYLNVAMGIGGLKPFPASYVCKKRYGDCKALTNYMKALLNHINIDAFYTLIYSGKDPVKIQQSLPSQQFNHVILCVPLDGDTIWLENTSSSSPGNYLGTFTQNRYGLLVKDTASTLVKTPSLKYSDVLEKSSYILDFDLAGDGSVSISNMFKGEKFDNLIHLFHEGTSDEQKSEIKKLLPLTNFEIQKWNIYQKDKEDLCLKMNIELSIQNQIKKIGKSFLIPTIPIGIPEFENTESRIYPVRINYPINREFNFEYNFPITDLFDIKLPQNIDISSKYGRYTETFSLENKKMMLLKTLQLNTGEYSLDEYEDFYSFIESITAAEKKSSVLLKHK